MARLTSEYLIYIKKHKMLLIFGVVISVVTALLTSYFMLDESYIATLKVKLQSVVNFGFEYDTKSISPKITISSISSLEKGNYDNLISDYSQVIISKSSINTINKNFNSNLTYKDYSQKVAIIRNDELDLFYVTFKDSNPKIAKESVILLTRELIKNSKKLSNSFNLRGDDLPIITSSYKTKNVIIISIVTATASITLSCIALFFLYMLDKIFGKESIMDIIEKTSKSDIFFASQELDNTISNIDQIIPYFVRNECKILFISSSQSSLYKSIIAQNFASSFSEAGFNTLVIKADMINNFVDGKSFLSDMGFFQKRKDEKDFELWTSDDIQDKDQDFLTIIRVKNNSNLGIKKIPEITRKFVDLFDVLVIDAVYPDKETLNKSLRLFPSLLMEVNELGCDLKLSKIA